MTSIISDTQLLERTMETFQEEMQIPDNESYTNIDKKTSQSNHAPKKQQMPMETSHEIQ